MRYFWLAIGMNCALVCLPVIADQKTTIVTGEIVDAKSGQHLPGRIYIRGEDGKWYFPKSAAAEGSAIEYRKERFKTSVEMHTTLSPHPFSVELPPGKYSFEIEHGKEFLPVKRSVEVGDQPQKPRFKLARWIDMAARGWYSGDTHVHRPIEELPNLMRAEDLNVALPLTYWVSVGYRSPTAGNRSTKEQFEPKPITVEPNRVIYPINTEYEIGRVNDKRHLLGAVFVLGHKKPLEESAPPVAHIASRARKEGALLDLDKHSWPWSLMLVPVMKVDLFELANNHVWRTEFGFRKWTVETVPKYMKLEADDEGLTEWGWIDFGFQSYYALLNCGFPMRVTAGTASGVHPVPLGFGRVYCQVDGEFTYEKWMQSLAAGRSFVTTGPMLFAKVDGAQPGSKLKEPENGKASLQVTGTAESTAPLRTIEIIVNGEIAKRITPKNEKTERGSFVSSFDTSVETEGSSWVAVRAFENRPDKRIRFAHSNPVHINVSDAPIRPRREEIDYMILRMREELKRNSGVLRPAGVKEYEFALRFYEEIAKRAR